MKRVRTVGMLLVLILLLAACVPAAAPATSSGDQAGSDASLGGEIVMWRFPLMDDQSVEEARWDEIVARFNEIYPDVTVNIETQPWGDRTQKLLSAIGSGRGPDVFYINPDMIPSFAEVGAIVPFNDYVDAEDVEAFNEATLIKWNGQIWGLPILQNVPLLVWNTTLVEQIGLDPDNLPETLEEFEVWAQVAAENDLYISTWRADSATAGLTALIWKFGGEIFDEEGNVVIDNPKTIAALTFSKMLYDNGWVSPDSITSSGDDDVALFHSQKALSLRIDGNRFYGSQESYVDNFDWAFGPILEGERKITNGTVGTYTISGKAADPALAAAWIKHATSPENSSVLNKTVGYLPPLKDAAEYYAGDEGAQELLELAKYVRTDPVFPVARQAYFILAEEHQAVLTGGKTPAEAAASMQERIEKAAQDLEQ